MQRRFHAPVPAAGKNCRPLAGSADGLAAQIACGGRVAGVARLLHDDDTRITHWPRIVIDRLEQDLNSFRAALGARSHRQEVLASNIANADTPHYKARDLDFRAALGAALGSRGAAPPVMLARTQPGHLGGAADDPYAGAMRYRAEYQGAVDGNTVNMDVERAAFAENALQVEALLTFISGRFRTLQSAIQGQ